MSGIAIWNYLKSVLMVTVNIKKLSDQIAELQSQLSSPSTYREELNLIKEIYAERIRLLEHEKQSAIEKKDLEKEQIAQKLIDEMKTNEKLIIENLELTTRWLRQNLGALGVNKGRNLIREIIREKKDEPPT